jgi:hypothetical protein
MPAGLEIVRSCAMVASRIINQIGMHLRLAIMVRSCRLTAASHRLVIYGVSPARNFPAFSPGAGGQISVVQAVEPARTFAGEVTWLSSGFGLMKPGHVVCLHDKLVHRTDDWLILEAMLRSLPDSRKTPITYENSRLGIHCRCHLDFPCCPWQFCALR